MGIIKVALGRGQRAAPGGCLPARFGERGIRAGRDPPLTCRNSSRWWGEQHPDVVVTDIRMPPTETDEGIQAAAWLREQPSRRGCGGIEPVRRPGVCDVALLEHGSAGPCLSPQGEGGQCRRTGAGYPRAAGRGRWLPEFVAHSTLRRACTPVHRRLVHRGADGPARLLPTWARRCRSRIIRNKR